MLKSPQLTPFSVEEQQIYTKIILENKANLISKAEPGHQFISTTYIQDFVLSVMVIL